MKSITVNLLNIIQIPHSIVRLKSFVFFFCVSGRVDRLYLRSKVKEPSHARQDCCHKRRVKITAPHADCCNYGEHYGNDQPKPFHFMSTGIAIAIEPGG